MVSQHGVTLGLPAGCLGRSQAARCAGPPSLPNLLLPLNCGRVCGEPRRPPPGVGEVLGRPSPCPWEEMPERLCQSRPLAAPSGKQLGAGSRPRRLSGGTGGTVPPHPTAALPGQVATLTALLSPQVVPESGARERERHAAQQAGQVRPFRHRRHVLCLAWNPRVTRKHRLLPG